MNKPNSKVEAIMRRVVRRTGLDQQLGFDDAMQELRFLLHQFVSQPELVKKALQSPDGVSYRSAEELPERFLWWWLHNRAVEIRRSFNPRFSGVYRSGLLVQYDDEDASCFACAGPDQPLSPEEAASVRELLRIVDKEMSPRETRVVEKLIEGHTEGEVGTTSISAGSACNKSACGVARSFAAECEPSLRAPRLSSPSKTAPLNLPSSRGV